MVWRDDPRGEMILNPLPWTLWVLTLPMVLAEVAFAAGEAGLLGGAEGLGWRVDAIRRLAVWPEYWLQQWDMGRFPADLMIRFVAYPFLHVGFSHMIFAVVILLATGKFVGDAMRPVVTLAVFFAASIGGALVYAAFSGEPALLIGAYPGAYGLIGGLSLILWNRSAGPMRERLQAFRMILMLLVLQVVYSLIFGESPGWKSEVPGFLIGFAVTALIARGEVRGIVQRLRQR